MRLDQRLRGSSAAAEIVAALAQRNALLRSHHKQSQRLPYPANPCMLYYSAVALFVSSEVQMDGFFARLYRLRCLLARGVAAVGSRLNAARRLCSIGVLALILAACASAPAATPAAQPQSGGDVTPVFAFSEAVVGPNRLAIGLLRNGSPINDPAAKVHIKIFDLSTSTPTALADAAATYYGQGLPAGIWVANVTFAQPGNVGVEVETQLPGQAQPSTRRFSLTVQLESAAPRVGQNAIVVETLTAKDVPDLKQLTSGPDPDPALYQISLVKALRSGKPTALLFATPNFCRTATCGPSVTVLSQLQKKFGDRMNFIHSEVYRYPFGDSAKLQAETMSKAQAAGRDPTPDELRAGLSDAMAAWKLDSEPWLFLIDAKGVIAARYEGGITSEELTPAIEQLLAGK